MADQIFGELRYEDDYGWWGKHTLEFGGNLHTVDTMCICLVLWILQPKKQ